jgi:hypothetical protein
MCFLLFFAFEPSRAPGCSRRLKIGQKCTARRAEHDCRAQIRIACYFVSWFFKCFHNVSLSFFFWATVVDSEAFGQALLEPLQTTRQFRKSPAAFNRGDDVVSRWNLCLAGPRVWMSIAMHANNLNHLVSRPNHYGLLVTTRPSTWNSTRTLGP